MMSEDEFIKKMKTVGATDEDIEDSLKVKNIIPLNEAYTFYVEHCIPKEGDVLRDYRLTEEGHIVDD